MPDRKVSRAAVVSWSSGGAAAIVCDDFVRQMTVAKRESSAISDRRIAQTWLRTSAAFRQLWAGDIRPQ
eukprot:4235936-Prymnesium_polylepis.1